jgi:glycogen debranching enzyme
MKFQHKHGQIPSNVDVRNKKVSYGGTTGRVDAILWFLVGFSQYVKRTGDTAFLKKHYKKFKKAYELVNLYEFNNKDFVYVPLSGDWADEYIQEGYILYDEVLYFLATCEYITMRRKLHKKTDMLEKKAEEIKKKIRINFVMKKENKNSEHIYDKILYERTLKKEKYKTPGLTLLQIVLQFFQEFSQKKKKMISFHILTKTFREKQNFSFRLFTLP